MKRHKTRIEDDTLYVETDDGWLEVGEMADVYALIGGKTYTIEYDEKQRNYAEWLDADDDGRMEIDVHETLAEMSYLSKFVENLRARDLELGGNKDYPRRTIYFSNYMVKIWDTKGNTPE